MNNNRNNNNNKINNEKKENNIKKNINNQININNNNFRIRNDNHGKNHQQNFISNHEGYKDDKNNIKKIEVISNEFKNIDPQIITFGPTDINKTKPAEISKDENIIQNSNGNHTNFSNLFIEFDKKEDNKEEENKEIKKELNNRDNNFNIGDKLNFSFSDENNKLLPSDNKTKEEPNTNIIKN